MKKFDIELASHQEMVAHVKRLGLKLHTRNMDTKRLRATLREYLFEKKSPAPRARPAMKKYQVTIVREVEHRAVVEVEAESIDVAKQMAMNIVDNTNPYQNCWREGDVVSQDFKVKEIV